MGGWAGLRTMPGPSGESREKDEPVSRWGAQIAAMGDADWADPRTRVAGWTGWTGWVHFVDREEGDQGVLKQGQAHDAWAGQRGAMHASELRLHQHQPPDDGSTPIARQGRRGTADQIRCCRLGIQHHPDCMY